jgi:integrase
VARILRAPPHLKSRALLMTIYAAGLHRCEVAGLRVNDIDSACMTIAVHQGKGQRDRLVMLPPVLLDPLRQYRRKTKPKKWLFLGTYIKQVAGYRRSHRGRDNTPFIRSITNAPDQIATRLWLLHC